MIEGQNPHPLTATNAIETAGFGRKSEKIPQDSMASLTPLVTPPQNTDHPTHPNRAPESRARVRTGRGGSDVFGGTK